MSYSLKLLEAEKCVEKGDINSIKRLGLCEYDEKLYLEAIKKEDHFPLFLSLLSGFFSYVLLQKIFEGLGESFATGFYSRKV